VSVSKLGVPLGGTTVWKGSEVTTRRRGPCFSGLRYSTDFEISRCSSRLMTCGRQDLISSSHTAARPSRPKTQEVHGVAPTAVSAYILERTSF